MPILQIAILAVVQGLAELLPVSSSAHVILAQKLMGMDPGAPEMTFLLVMLHTGTMFAVLGYFWPRWRAYLAPLRRNEFLTQVVIATAATGVLGLTLKVIIEKIVLEHVLHLPKGEIEHLFRVMPAIAAALVAAGVIILWAASKEAQAQSSLGRRSAFHIGWVQGLCLPFRGFSRSGATISTAMIQGVSRTEAEDFSFALAVVLTPPVILLQLKRLLSAQAEGVAIDWSALLTPGLVGMLFSAVAGWFALKWLSAWLEKGRWNLFGYYCLGMSVLVLGLWGSGLI